jgi:hypothetical protein
VRGALGATRPPCHGRRRPPGTRGVTACKGYKAARVIRDGEELSGGFLNESGERKGAAVRVKQRRGRRRQLPHLLAELPHPSEDLSRGGHQPGCELLRQERTEKLWLFPGKGNQILAVRPGLLHRIHGRAGQLSWEVPAVRGRVDGKAEDGRENGASSHPPQPRSGLEEQRGIGQEGQNKDDEEQAGNSPPFGRELDFPAGLNGLPPHPAVSVKEAKRVPVHAVLDKATTEHYKARTGVVKEYRRRQVAALGEPGIGDLVPQASRR